MEIVMVTARTKNDLGAEEKSTIELFRDLLHALLFSSVDSWINLQLSVPQLRTLFAVAHQPDCPIGQIAVSLGIGKATAGHLVDKLVQAGFVERYQAPTDRRSLLLRLSSEGKHQIDLLLGWERLMKAGLGKIPPNDEEVLRRTLAVLVERVGKAAFAGSPQHKK
jgi:DNA-binding MarR family transcriptional regulator